MGKLFRARLHPTKSRSQIRKGTSSATNPATSRFRDAARAERVVRRQPIIAVDDRLEQSNADSQLMRPMNKMIIDEEDDDGGNRSMISEGGMSRITQFTNCTNPTFSAVHRQWTSGSSLQADVVAVLAAVSNAIREQNGSDSDADYFMALLATLRSITVEELPKTAACAYLLQTVIRKLPREILIDNFQLAYQVIIEKLNELAAVNGAVAIKFLLSSLGAVLRVQPLRVWTEKSVRSALLLITAFAVHDKPTVRTISRRVVRGIITDPVSCPDSGIHPAAKLVGERVLNDLKSEKQSATLTRLLCLLEGFLHKLPEETFVQLVAQVLELGSTADPMVRCAAYQCLYRALQREPSEHVLSTESNVKLITVITSFPSPADVGTCAYWLQACAEAYVCLSIKDPKQSAKLIVDGMQTFTKAYDRGDTSVAETVHAVINRLVEHTIGQNSDAATQCLTDLDNALGAQNTVTWKYVFLNMVELFKHSGLAVSDEIFGATLSTLANLRERDIAPGTSEDFCAAEIESVIGSAIEYVDAEKVLRAIPLNIDPSAPVVSTEFKRSWLLILLKKRIKNSPLSLFIKFFLPLSVAIHERCVSLDGLAKKLYTVTEDQIWDLLPNFMRSPADFELAFPKLAPILGAALNQRPDLRLKVLAGIRAALRYANAPDSTDERREIVRRYAKNFVPILFGIYTTPKSDGTKKTIDDRDLRASLLETVRTYVPSIPRELITEYVNSALKKVSDDTNSEEKKMFVMDLLITMCCCVDVECALRIFAVVNPWFSEKNNRRMQKKAYRVLSEFFNRASDPINANLFEKISEPVEALITCDTSTVYPSSWAPRIAVFRSILSSLDTLDKCKVFSEHVFSQVVMCLDKSRGQACRQTAAKCFQEMIMKLTRLSDELSVPKEHILDRIEEQVFAFGGKFDKVDDLPLEKARAVVIALNLLAHAHLKEMNGALVTRMINHAALFLSDKRPAVRHLAIRLVRMFCRKLPEYALRQYQDVLLTAVFKAQCAEGNNMSIRRANNILFNLLLDKFGYEVLQKYASHDELWLKVLKNLVKAKRRSARKEEDVAGMAQNTDADAMSSVSQKTLDADSIFNMLEDSDDEKEMETGDRYEQRSTVWIKEGAEDEDDDDAVDLLDRKSVLSRVVMKAPISERASTSSKPKKKDEFRLANDGRFVIEDDEMDTSDREDDDDNDEDM